MWRCCLLLLVLLACSTAFGKAELGASRRAPQIDPTVKWLFDIANDSSDTPRGKVYLIVGERKVLIRPHAIGEYHALEPAEYQASKVPAAAIIACSNWWAGGGEDLYVIRRSRQLIVYIRYLDESVRIGGYRQLKVIPAPISSTVLAKPSRTIEGLVQAVSDAYIARRLGDLDVDHPYVGRVRIVIEHSLAGDNDKDRFVVRWFRSLARAEKWLKSREHDEMPGRDAKPLEHCKNGVCTFDFASGIVHNNLYLNKITYGSSKGRPYLKTIYLLDGD